MKRLCITILLLLIVVSIASAKEDTGIVPAGCKTIGLIHFNTNDFKIVGHTRREIDALVPKLKKLGKRKLVKIEGRWASEINREEYIANSFYLAKEVRSYLIIKHHLKLDLYIGAMDDTMLATKRHVVRIVLYPNELSEEIIDSTTNMAGQNKESL